MNHRRSNPTIAALMGNLPFEQGNAMATVYDLKPHFQTLLRPIANRLAKGGITPNQVTIAALLLSIGTGLLVALAARYGRFLLLIPAVL
jgi:CDP-diacylglycerol--glycerol-3-phosphate 3-phosphatidyltransferase